MKPDVLLVGCGDLGADIGMRLARRGHTVVAVRRRSQLVPAPLIGVSVDLTQQAPSLPDMDLQLLVVALTARPRTTEAYRGTYVEGLRRVLDTLARDGQTPSRAVLVSSTGVYPDGSSSKLVDEDTSAQPKDGPAGALREAEELFTSHLPHGTVLRLSGLYGRGPSRLATRVSQGQIKDPNRWTNRIHREDAAGAVVHLLTRPQAPDGLYIGTDDEPALLGDVAAYLAARHGGPTPPAVDRAASHGRRLSNARLRETGWAPTYPSFREGFATAPQQ